MIYDGDDTNTNSRDKSVGNTYTKKNSDQMNNNIFYIKTMPFNTYD